MSCCPQGVATLTDRHRMRLHYRGGRPVVVKGPVTGIDYRFSGMERIQIVDPRDAIVIARNGLFRIEGIIELPDEAARSRSGGTRA